MNDSGFDARSGFCICCLACVWVELQHGMIILVPTESLFAISPVIKHDNRRARLIHLFIYFIQKTVIGVMGGTEVTVCAATDSAAAANTRHTIVPMIFSDLNNDRFFIKLYSYPYCLVSLILKSILLAVLYPKLLLQNKFLFQYIHYLIKFLSPSFIL